MKILKLILSISLGLLFSAHLASAIPGRAEVKLVVENAAVTKAGGATIPLKTGMVLEPGDTVTTGNNSSAFLWLGINGESVIVAANTVVNLEELEITNVEEGIVKTKLNVTKGKVVGVVKNKLAAASVFEIKTVKGVARIQGTQYVFADDGTLIVLEGAVNYSYTENGVTKTVQVSQGQQFKIGDPQPSVYRGGFSMDPDALSFFVDILNSSGVSISEADGIQAVLKALSSALDINQATLQEFLISAGVAKDVTPTGTAAQPIDTTVIPVSASS
jgi:hypothetical protein